MRLRNLLATVWERHAARKIYWSLDTELGRLHRVLGRQADPADRAATLNQLAVVQYEQARVHDAAWGVDRFPADCRDVAGDMAQSMRYSARLYRLLGYVETAVAYGLGGRPCPDRPVDVAAAGVMERMAAMSDLGARMALLEELGWAVLPVVGGQAAETVFCLPWPGKPAWNPKETVR